MWWFSRAAQGKAPAVNMTTKQQAEAELLALVPDLSDVAEGNEVAIKIWLPEMVARTVKWLADYADVSQSAWLRERLVIYTYGMAAAQAQRLREQGDILFSRKPVDRTQGRWIYKVPQLGKNTIAFKLWIGNTMKGDLQALADHAATPLSAFVREVLVSDLLGHASLPERSELTGEPTAQALAWEAGQEVPMKDIEEDAFDRLGVLGEATQVWVDESEKS